MKGGRPSPQNSSPHGIPTPSKDSLSLEERGRSDTVPSSILVTSSPHIAAKEKEEGEQKGEEEEGGDIEESGRGKIVPTPAPTQSHCSTGPVTAPPSATGGAKKVKLVRSQRISLPLYSDSEDGEQSSIVGLSPTLTFDNPGPNIPCTSGNPGSNTPCTSGNPGSNISSTSSNHSTTSEIKSESNLSVISSTSSSTSSNTTQEVSPITSTKPSLPSLARSDNKLSALVIAAVKNNKSAKAKNSLVTASNSSSTANNSSATANNSSATASNSSAAANNSTTKSGWSSLKLLDMSGEAAKQLNNNNSSTSGGGSSSSNSAKKSSLAGGGFKWKRASVRAVELQESRKFEHIVKQLGNGVLRSSEPVPEVNKDPAFEPLPQATKQTNSEPCCSYIDQPASVLRPSEVAQTDNDNSKLVTNQNNSFITTDSFCHLHYSDTTSLSAVYSSDNNSAHQVYSCSGDSAQQVYNSSEIPQNQVYSSDSVSQVYNSSAQQAYNSAHIVYNNCSQVYRTVYSDNLDGHASDYSSIPSFSNNTLDIDKVLISQESSGESGTDSLLKDDSLCLGGDQLDIAFLDSEFTVAQSDLVTQSSTEGTFQHTNQHNQHHFQHHINSHNQVEYELSTSPPPPVIVHPDFNRTRSLDLPQYCVSCEREAHGNCVGTSVDEDDIQGDPLVYATFVAPIQQYSTETDSSRQQSFNSQPSINSRQPSFNSRQQSFNSQRQPGSNLSSRQPSFGSRQQSFNSRQPSCVNSRQPSCNSLHGSRQHSSRQPSFSKQNSLEVETFCEGRGLNKKSSSSCLSVPGYNSSPHFSHNSRESSSEPVIVTIPYKDTVSKSEEFLNTENKSDQLFAEKKNSGIPCQNTNVAEAGSQDLNGKDISHNHTGDLNNKTTPVPNSTEAGMETLERIGGGGSSSQNARGKCRRLQECNNTNKTNCNRWEGNEAVNCDGGHVNNSRWSPTADNWLATDTTDDLDSEATQELQELNHQLNEERLSFIHSQSSSKEDDYKEFKEEEYNVPTPPPPPPPMHQVPIMPPIPPTPVTGAGGNIGGKPRESTPMIHGPSSIGFRQESSQGGWGSGEESPTPPPEPIEPSQQSHTSTIRRKSKRDRNKTTIVTSERTNNCNSSCHNSTTQAATNSSERLNNVCNKKNSNKARSKSRSPGRSRGSGGGMDRAIVIVHHTTCTHHSGSSRSRDMSPEDNVSEESSLSLYQEHDDGITSPCDVESGNSADMVPPMPPVRTSSMDHLVHHTGDHLVHHTGDHLSHHTGDHLVHHTGGLDHGGLDYNDHGELDHTTAPPPGWDSCQTNIKNSRVHPSAPPMHPQYQGDVEHYHRTSAGSTPGGRGSTPGGRGSTPGGRNLQYSNWESCRESWFSSGSDCAPRPSSGSDCPPQPTYMANTRTVDTENPTTVHPKQVSTGSGSDSHILSSSYRCHSPPPPPPSSQQYYGTLGGRGSSGTTNYQFSSTLPKMAHNHKMKTSIPNLRQVSREVPNLRQSSRESGSSSSRPSSRDRPLPPTRSQIRTISPKHERRAVSSINLSKPQDQQSRDSTPSESIGSSLQSGPSLPRLDFDQTLGVSNLVDLEPLTEDAALTNLNIRFKNDQIYTWSSSVLLSINCYKKLSLYTPEVIDAYRSQPSCQLPPHIYSLADRGWHALRDRGEDQAVILTGESGSGKTEAGKLVLQYIAAVTHHSSEFHDIKYQLLQSNPVLEAFGNAKTLHNDNSSRFGKYLEVSFDFKGDPTGGYINHYLLEKTRVTGFQPGDRNFHIFYQIIAGADIHLLKDLKLQRSLENYQLLRSGSEAASQGMRSEAGQSQSQKGGSVADRRDFIITKTALEDLGVDSGERLDLLKLVAVVLKLGNLTFLPTTNMDGTEGCTIANDYELYESCDLLLGDPVELKSALISRTVAINSDIIVSELSALEAADGRDRLCRTLYTRLFTWLVNRINQAIKVKTHKKHNVLGILDIYGFEAFETNSFEQFIINFANEKIQQVFVDWTFRKEQQEIVGEGLQWSQIGYFSNSVICSLIEQPGRGILPILDNLSNKLGDCAVTGNIADFQTGDLDLLQGLDETFSNHPHYEASSTFAHTVASGGSEPSNGGEPGGEAAASDQEQDSGVPAPAEAFRIKHYAGSVTYSVSGFLSKNCDYLDPSISRILYASEHNLLKTLFPEGNLKRCVRRKPVTLGTQFKISLGALFTNLYSKTPHFIRCIKPNESKTPRLFDTSLVQHQFRYLGVMELTRLRSAGFVYHETYDRFLARYKLLCPHTWPSWRGSPVDGVTYIFREVPLAGSDYAFGNTKIFIRRVETMEKLEEWRLERIQDLATMIQKIWRGYKARKNWSQLRESQIVISGCWKRWKDKSNIIDVKTRQENDRAARVIQRAFRTCQRRRWLIYLAHALPSESPISRDWPRPPPSLIQASNVLRRLYHRWRCERFRERFDQTARNRMREKVTASLIFKDKKSSYPKSVGFPFIGDYIGLRRNPLWRETIVKNHLHKMDRYIVFADIVNKINRTNGKFVPILFVISTSSMLILDQRTMQIKYRVPAGELVKLSLSPFLDDIAVFHVRASSPTHEMRSQANIPNCLSSEAVKRKGDFVFQTGHVIEIVTKLFLVVQNCTGKPPAVNISTQFNANFGTHSVTLQFKSIGDGSTPGSQMKILKKGNKMEVVL